MKLAYTKLTSPVGTLHVLSGSEGLCALAFDDRWDQELRVLRARFGEVELRGRVPAELTRPIRAYVRGDLSAIDEIPVDPGGTPFQQRVWAELRNIRAGESISYGELARRIDRPKAVRAVGAANGRNPIAVVIPCHRVIGSGGKLHGYGGGLDRKQWLLEHEGALDPLFRSAGQAARKTMRTTPGTTTG